MVLQARAANLSAKLSSTGTCPPSRSRRRGSIGTDGSGVAAADVAGGLVVVVEADAGVFVALELDEGVVEPMDGVHSWGFEAEKWVTTVVRAPPKGPPGAGRGV